MLYFRKPKLYLTKIKRSKVETKPFFHCQVTLILRGKPYHYTGPIRPNFSCKNKVNLSWLLLNVRVLFQPENVSKTRRLVETFQPTYLVS